MCAAKSYEIDGRSMTLSEWSKFYGLPKGVVANRVCSRGWDLERALTTPVRYRDSYRDSFRELAESNGIDVGTYKARLRLGWSRWSAASVPTRKYSRAGSEEEKDVRTEAEDQVKADDTPSREEAMFAVLKFIWNNLDLDKKERLVHMVRVAAEMWSEDAMWNKEDAS